MRVLIQFTLLSEYGAKYCKPNRTKGIHIKFSNIGTTLTISINRSDNLERQNAQEWQREVFTRCSSHGVIKKDVKNRHNNHLYVVCQVPRGNDESQSRHRWDLNSHHNAKRNTAGHFTWYSNDSTISSPLGIPIPQNLFYESVYFEMFSIVMSAVFFL